MKLDDEMRQACALALNVIPANLSPNHIAAFAAGYRMGLERAGQTGYDWLNEHVGIRTAEAVAAAIRGMARD